MKDRAVRLGRTPLLPGRTPLLPGRPRPLVFAHRGCSSLAPENTMAAFAKARDYGAPGIELDIHATADGKLVVTHDDDFIRTAPADNNGGGNKPEVLSYGEIQHIDVGSFFGSQWAAQRPPLLEMVLEEFCPAMYVDIELKSRKTKDDPLPVLLAEKLKQLGETISASVTVSSFNPFALGAFRREWQKIIGADSSRMAIALAIIWSADHGVPWILRRGFGRILCGCDYVKPAYKQAGRFSLLRFSVLEGRPVVPWTVDDPALAETLLKNGCQGIITNRPQDFVFLQGHNLRKRIAG